jgi:hypothetical protein
MTEASRKLVEESAANGRSLVISEDGEVYFGPAFRTSVHTGRRDNIIRNTLLWMRKKLF